MTLPILQTILPNTKINFTTNMQVGETTRFRGYTFLGLQPFAVARAMAGQDPTALVAATRAYFRQGSETNPESILFLAVRQGPNTPIMLVPEPLVQANSVQSVNKISYVVRIEDEVSRDTIAAILASNGLNKFTITTEVT